MKCLFFLLFLLCFGLEFSRGLPATIHDITPNELKENGTNVCFDTATTYKQVNVSYSEQTVRTVYHITCYWGRWRCHPISRQQIVSVTKWREEWREVEKKIFRCCSGWIKKADDAQVCLQPICAFGCRNGGECIAPETCKCKRGYEGQYCQLLVDECAAKVAPVCNQTCTPKTPGHDCSCKHGWRMLGDKKSCEDIDECKAVTPPCKCETIDGVCNVTCENLQGSYRCNCRHGYHLTSAQQCKDTDECIVYPDICNQGCKNKPGTYECTCWTGFKLNNITNKCIDIDECKVAKGGCSDICKNIEGSYVCMCPPRFYLGPDRKTCIAIKPTMRNKVICQSDPSGKLTCRGDDKKVMIIDAIYGRLTKDYCQHGNYTQDLRCKSKDSPMKVLKAACDHRASCTITITKKVFGDPCPAIEKYLQVTYDCM